MKSLKENMWTFLRAFGSASQDSSLSEPKPNDLEKVDVFS